MSDNGKCMYGVGYNRKKNDSWYHPDEGDCYSECPAYSKYPSGNKAHCAYVNRGLLPKNLRR
jgi:hypothetical protein